jgi:hypothetical protein
MPKASERRAVNVNPGDFASMRKAYRTSCHRVANSCGPLDLSNLILIHEQVGFHY